MGQPKILQKVKQFLAENDPNMPLNKMRHVHPQFAKLNTAVMKVLLTEPNGMESILGRTKANDETDEAYVESLHDALIACALKAAWAQFPGWVLDFSIVLCEMHYESFKSKQHDSWPSFCQRCKAADNRFLFNEVFTSAADMESIIRLRTQYVRGLHVTLVEALQNMAKEHPSDSLGETTQKMIKRFRAVGDFIELCFNEICAIEVRTAEEELWLQFWSRTARTAVSLMDRKVKVKTAKDVVVVTKLLL